MLPSSHLVYIRQNTLSAAPFDLGRLAVTRPAEPVLEEVNSNMDGGGDFDFSQTGTLVYVSARGPSLGRQIAWLESTGQTKPLQVTLGHYENPRFSPDGRQALCSGSEPGRDVGASTKAHRQRYGPAELLRRTAPRMPPGSN